MNTRSSAKRKPDKDSKGSGWVESAYDADEDTTSDSSLQQSSDPYEFNFKDDVEVKAKKKKQARNAQNRKVTKKGSKNPKSNVTSTPVLIGHLSDDARGKHSNLEKELLITPEVTPILPIKPENCNMGSLDDSCDTPTVRRSLRKRSLRLADHLSSVASFKSSSSQRDSGIVVSPPLKKMKSPESLQSNPSPKRDPPLIMTKERKQAVLHKENLPAFAAASADLNIQKKRKVFVHKRENEVVKKCKNDVSSFSFESSPIPDERFPKSPFLFSDSPFSDVAAEVISKVPKKSARSYTSLKAKSQKVQKQISKLDSWANELNSQIADIEKFELIIE